MAKAAKCLFICLDNADYEIFLERLKIYVALPDAKPGRSEYLRIIDESGEYLFPSQRFVSFDYGWRKPASLNLILSVLASLAVELRLVAQRT